MVGSICEIKSSNFRDSQREIKKSLFSPPQHHDVSVAFLYRCRSIYKVVKKCWTDSWLTESHVGSQKKNKFIHLTTHRSQFFKAITLYRHHGNRVSMMLPLAFWFHLMALCACFEVEWVNCNKFSFNCCLFSSPAFEMYVNMCTHICTERRSASLLN